MMMVIFGAGASYDSVPALPPSRYGRRGSPNRPPLATELFLDYGVFADSLAYFPECDPIIPYLRSIPRGETFEHVLETLHAEGDTDSRRKCQMAAVRFYLQLMISGCEFAWRGEAGRITNHVTLLDQLRRCREASEPVLLVTFNYDRLIENALTSVGVTITDIKDYVRHDAFKLFKLHGSVDWGREVEAPDIDLGVNVWETVRNLIGSASDLKVSDCYRMSDDRPIGRFNNVPLFPAIAIPVETKRDFECPNDHLDCLRAHVGKITKLLIIGWRATEGHFLKLLRENLTTEIHVQGVAGTKRDAEDALAHIRDAGIQIIGAALDGGFTEYAVSREAERFFRT